MTKYQNLNTSMSFVGMQMLLKKGNACARSATKGNPKIALRIASSDPINGSRDPNTSPHRRSFKSLFLNAINSGGGSTGLLWILFANSRPDSPYPLKNLPIFNSPFFRKCSMRSTINDQGAIQRLPRITANEITESAQPVGFIPPSMRLTESAPTTANTITSVLKCPCQFTT